jgi:hypothetical protein
LNGLLVVACNPEGRANIPNPLTERFKNLRREEDFMTNGLVIHFISTTVILISFCSIK